MAGTNNGRWGCCLAAALLLTACSKDAEEPPAVSNPEPALAADAAPSAAPALSEVQQSLKAGSYDDAAARLLALQAAGRPFSAKEAAEYRKAMNEAYTQALEAAERGDTKAQAALQMIRAANAR